MEPGPERPRAGLRRRLVGAFLLVTVLPLVLFSTAVAVLFQQGLERATRDRLDTSLEAVRLRFAALAARARQGVASAAADDLPALGPGDDDRLLDEIARRRELPVLELIDGAGIVIASHHWPAGFGLPDRDGLFPGSPPYRVETVAAGYGAEERLAVVAEVPGRWRGRSVRLRGGSFADRELLADLAALIGLEVGLYDEVRGRWIAAPGSPLLAWNSPSLVLGAARGEARIGEAKLRWAAAPLCTGLMVVVAAPEGALDLTLRQVRRLGTAAAALALLGTLAGALIVSGRLARPIRELAEGARRVAGGDLRVSVPVRTEDEIGGLARAFNDMTAELRGSRPRLVQAERVAAWREIARRLAHELKKPLFPIQLSIETLRRLLDREPPPARGEFEALFRDSSDTILQELRSLGRVVDSFGDLARLPKPRLVPLDLSRLADQVLALYRRGASHVTIETDLTDPLTVNADGELLARALGNLVTNALEAMPDHGTLRLRTAATGEGAVVEITDTGPGLSEEQRTHLFTPYRTTKSEGTGLGLVIAQGIAADHGGRIEVAAGEPGQGATFRLVLPGTTREKLPA
jgi:two-component system, NtrC family, nitrogen regulation sensor histidine kinase NtrY